MKKLRLGHLVLDQALTGIRTTLSGCQTANPPPCYSAAEIVPKKGLRDADLPPWQG